MRTKRDFSLLPEDCIIHILSFTTCRDVCVLSMVSTACRSVSSSDVLWEHFLPSDYASILSRSVHPVQYESKRELYFRLCDYPVLIDGGKLCFGLDKSTGAKCFTISAHELNFEQDRMVWEFIPTPGTRFPVAAKLLPDGFRKAICLFYYRIDSQALPLYTTYTTYLIFRLPEILNTNEPLRGIVSIDGIIKCERKFYLSLKYKKPVSKFRLKDKSDEEFLQMLLSYPPYVGLRLPKQRADGWMEVEMGEVYNQNLENRNLQIILRKGHNPMTIGTEIHGIELRPKGV